MTSADPDHELVLPKEPWAGNARAMAIAGVLGVIGLAGWAFTVGGGPEHAYYSYLWAFTFWLTICVGALGWVAAFYAAKAKWPILLRRPLESIAAATPILALLFIPVIIGMKSLYPWMSPDVGDEETRRLIEWRHAWINHGFVIARVIVYFLVFIIVGELFLRWSRGQDERPGSPEGTARSWRLGPASLPFLGFAISFFGFDWLLSLNTNGYSSMFGLYFSAGGIMSSLAMWIIASHQLGVPMSLSHRHSMAKLLFAFTCFWAYTAFAQFLLQWIADIPGEIIWNHMRLDSGWKTVGWFLVFGHFAFPFCFLMPKWVKFNRTRLQLMAVYLLICHAVDVYWIIMPQFAQDGPHPALSDLFAFMGIGGIGIAFVLFRMRGKYLVPVGDPFLTPSLEYHP
jgi:hypothetical protein